MVATYIVYKGEKYSTSFCTFYKDCVYVSAHSEFDEEFIAPNGTYEYVEEEIEVNPLNFQTHIDNETAKRERRLQAIELAKASFSYMWPKNPYQEQLEDRKKYPFFTDYLFDSDRWETEEKTEYPFFNVEVYKEYQKCLADYKALWNDHLNFFLTKIEE